MQVGSSSDLAKQLQALQNAALGQYQSNSDFSLLLQTGGSDSGANAGPASGSGGASNSTSASDGNWQLSGNFTGGAVYAVGTFGANGQLNRFSQQQVQSELDAIQQQRKASYSDALQNFMTLSQASGQLADTTMTTQTQFTGDNGLIGGSYQTSLSLNQV